MDNLTYLLNVIEQIKTYVKENRKKEALEKLEYVKEFLKERPNL